MDSVFASRSLHERLRVQALNSPEEWGPSDHSRVLIRLDTQQRRVGPTRCSSADLTPTFLSDCASPSAVLYSSVRRGERSRVLHTTNHIDSEDTANVVAHCRHVGGVMCMGVQSTSISMPLARQRHQV